MAALEADLAACLQQELQPCLARYAAAKQERGALDFTDLLMRARDLLRRDRDVRADFQRALPAAVRGRVPGHRSDPGRDPAAARGRRSRRGRLDARAPRARQAVHRRRPEAGDLPVPARRRRDVLAGQASARGRGRRGLRAAHVLPKRAGPPARDQPRVLAGDGRRPRRGAGRLRGARAGAERPGRRSRRSSRCPCPGPTSRST